MTGSPAYLAPEVAAGQRGDEAVDVWSLGATLFHVLAGRPPYDIGDNVLGGLYRIVHEEPPRLADAGWLAPLLEATMVKDPAQRWSMPQVRDFLAAGPGNSVLPAAGHRSPGRHPVDPAARTRRRRSRPPRAGARRGRRPARAGAGRRGPRLTQAADAHLAARRAGGGTGAGAGGVRRPPRRAVDGHRRPGAGEPGDLPVRPGDQRPSQPHPEPQQQSQPQPEPEPHPERHPRRPTARGMESFIRDYVATVSTNPDRPGRC